MGKRRRIADMSPGPVVDSLLAARPVAELNVRQRDAAAAESAVRSFLETHHRRHAGEVVSIITGKGLRSEGAPVLEPRIRALLDGELARFVASFSRDSARGRFLVRVRR